MNLFDILPENYFSIFVGKNKRIYAESLLILYSLFNVNESLMSKSDFIRALRDKLDEIDSYDTSEDEDEEDDDDLDYSDDYSPLLRNTPQSKANAICRRLEETGWIEIIQDPTTLEELIVLPAYSISFIKAIKDSMTEEESQYTSIVHATFSELMLEDEQLDDYLYDTLKRCYNHANELKRDLNILSNQIYIFQNRLGKLHNSNLILHEHFDLYKRRVIERYYHPLKTRDSIAKYSKSITRILDRWLHDEKIREQLVEQASPSMPNLTHDEVEREIINMINYVSDSLDAVSKQMNEIDRQNSEYTDNSRGKIEYLNNNDKTIKGHLENILKTYAENANNPRMITKILNIIQNGCCFYEQGYIDTNSVTLPIVRRFRYDATPLAIPNLEDISTEVMNSFYNETKNIYTNERIDEFMRLAFGNLDEITISDIPLPNLDAFICIILATVRKDNEDCFYIVEDIDGTYVKNNNYIVPNLLFRKKEHYDTED